MLPETVIYFPSEIETAIKRREEKGSVADLSSRVESSKADGLKTEPGLQSDEELLIDLAKGSRDSLSFLFRRHARTVRAVAFRVLRDSAEADDLVQDVFLFLSRKASLFDPAKGSGRSWIIQVAYHRSIDRKRYLNSRKFYSLLGLDDAEISTPTFRTAYEESIEGVLGRETLREIKDSLSLDQLRVIELHFYEGHTIDEIAREMKQTVGNVRNHYYRGLEKIREGIAAAKLRTK